MPFISDYGAGSTADAINSAGDRIRGSFDAARQRDAASAEQNRLLHPKTNAWLQKVINGEMTPAEAAAAAHSEIDGEKLLARDPSKLGEYGEQGMTAPPGGMSPKPPLMPTSVAPDSGMTAPFTARDAEDAANIGKISSSSAGAKANLQYVKNQGNMGVQSLRNEGNVATTGMKVKGAGERAGLRAETSDKDREERKRAAQAKIGLERDKMREMTGRANRALELKDRLAKEGKIDKQTQQVFDRDAKEIMNIRNNITRLQAEKLRGAAQGLDVDAETELNNEIDTNLEHMNMLLEDLEKAQDASQTQLGSRQSLPAQAGSAIPPPKGAVGPSYRPNQTMGPQPGVPPLRQGAEVREPPMGAGGGSPLPDPSALPERRGSNTGAAQPTDGTPKFINLKNKKTGQVAVVPADKVAAAESAPGFADMYEVVGVNNAFGP